jgi:hypothetical protein
MPICQYLFVVLQGGGRGGDDFRPLRQACQTLPKAITSPPALGFAYLEKGAQPT